MTKLERMQNNIVPNQKEARQYKESKKKIESKNRVLQYLAEKETACCFGSIVFNCRVTVSVLCLFLAVWWIGL